MCLLTTHLTHAQTNALHQFVDKYKDQQGFTFAYLSKELFEVVSKSNIKDQDWKKLHRFVRDLGSLHLLAADSIQNGLSLYKEALETVPADEFSELLTVRDGKENVRIWVKDAGATVTDLILLVGSPDEFVLISFTGNIELGNLTDLAHLFDAGDVDQLAKTTKDFTVDFTIGPNPSNGDFTLQYTDADDQPTLLTITDQNGRRLSTLNLSGQSVQQIRIHDLPTGLYWLQMQTQKGKIGIKQIQIVR